MSQAVRDAGEFGRRLGDGRGGAATRWLLTMSVVRSNQNAESWVRRPPLWGIGFGITQSKALMRSLATIRIRSSRSYIERTFPLRKKRQRQVDLMERGRRVPAERVCVMTSFRVSLVRVRSRSRGNAASYADLLGGPRRVRGPEQRVDPGVQEALHLVGAAADEPVRVGQRVEFLHAEPEGCVGGDAREEVVVLRRRRAVRRAASACPRTRSCRSCRSPPPRTPAIRISSATMKGRARPSRRATTAGWTTSPPLTLRARMRSASADR